MISITIDNSMRIKSFIWKRSTSLNQLFWEKVQYSKTPQSFQQEELGTSLPSRKNTIITIRIVEDKNITLHRQMSLLPILSIFQRTLYWFSCRCKLHETLFYDETNDLFNLNMSINQAVRCPNTLVLTWYINSKHKKPHLQRHKRYTHPSTVWILLSVNFF